MKVRQVAPKGAYPLSAVAIRQRANSFKEEKMAVKVILNNKVWWRDISYVLHSTREGAIASSRAILGLD